MRFWSIPALMISLGVAPVLQAQDAHVGVALNLSFPTGAFQNTTYPANTSLGIPQQQEGYDVGLGAQCTIGFPVDPKVALRLNFCGQGSDGSNTAPGKDRINLHHNIFSIGGEAEIYVGRGSAFRHRGTYLIGGISADFERFDRSFGDPNTDYTETSRKSRMGGTVGMGHSFGYDGGGRFTLETVFHKTLSGNDTGAGDPPSTDFVKVGFGWVF